MEYLDILGWKRGIKEMHIYKFYDFHS
jgi:hypothetical protein